MQRLILILACVPITPIFLGIVALYRRWRNREHTQIISAPAMPIVE